MWLVTVNEVFTAEEPQFLSGYIRLLARSGLSHTENCSSFADAALSFILECSTCGLVVETMRGIFGNVPLQYCGIHLSSQKTMKIHGYINMLLSGVHI